jgi:hypothetical protein
VKRCHRLEDRSGCIHGVLPYLDLSVRSIDRSRLAIHYTLLYNLVIVLLFIFMAAIGACCCAFPVVLIWVLLKCVVKCLLSIANDEEQSNLIASTILYMGFTWFCR